MNIKEYSVRDTTRKGEEVQVRAVHPDDRSAMVEAAGTLSPRTLHLRFFSENRQFSGRDYDRAVQVDFESVVGLVVSFSESDEAIVAGGRYMVYEDASGTKRAEVAFLVLDEFHGRGLGTLVMRHLVALARAQNIVFLEAVVLARNRAMLAVFRSSGLPMTTEREGNEVHVALEL